MSTIDLLVVAAGVLLLIAPGVVAAVRAETSSRGDPDYGVEAQLHGIHRQLLELHGALAEFLTVPLPAALTSDPASREAERSRAKLAVEEARRDVQAVLDPLGGALRALPGAAPLQALEAAGYALESADRCLYQHDQLVHGALRLAALDDRGDVEGAQQLERHILIARREADHHHRRVLEEAHELQAILASD